MQMAKVSQIPHDAELLFKHITNIYWVYLNGLEEYIKKIPVGEEALMQRMHQHIQDVQAALEHDVALFDQAVQSDKEDMHKWAEQSQIHKIKEQLKQ